VNLRKSQAGLSLLSQYAGPEAVAKEEQSAAEALGIAAKGRLSEARIEQILTAAKQSLGVPMLSAEQELMKDLVDEIRRLKKKQSELDAQIESYVEEDPLMRAMATVVGAAAAAAIFVYIGEASQYTSAHAYEKASGLNLKERSSGKYKGVLKITKRGPPLVRQLLYLAVWRLCESNPTIRAWYEARTGFKAGHKMIAAVAVMRKLIRALWAMTHNPDAIQEFESKKLFDVERLKVQETSSRRAGFGARQSTHRSAPTSKRSDRNPQQPAQCSAPTGKRSGRGSQPSAKEVQQPAL
jgi:transposase